MGRRDSVSDSLTCARVVGVRRRKRARGVLRGTRAGVKGATHLRAVLGEVRRRADVAAVEERALVLVAARADTFLALRELHVVLQRRVDHPHTGIALREGGRREQEPQQRDGVPGAVAPAREDVAWRARVDRCRGERGDGRANLAAGLTFSFPVLRFLLGDGTGGSPRALGAALDMITEARQSACRGRAGPLGSARRRGKWWQSAHQLETPADILRRFGLCLKCF